MISLEDVQRIRGRIADAQRAAAQRFRDAFPVPAHAHLEMQAAALIKHAEGVRLRGTVRYDIRGDRIVPYVEPGQPIYPFFTIDPNPVAIFEYWLIVSDIEASPSWRVTRIIATAEEYDEALRRMREPQIVRALVPSLLPDAHLHDDGTALLTVTVYTRAQEERVERRSLRLDENNELHFHGRELIAEGRAGVVVL